ncbi:heme-binding protein [Novosphingobium sp.]|uniref:SOUL family heme-binding protein n=1 Tax=Novosphingobium sp. TaxID=1874826 RepID=UPI0025E620FE|nr:heme-binding protein [Novosphingobium sp.]
MPTTLAPARTTRIWRWLAALGLLIVLAITGTSVMAIEEPKFTLSSRDGAFEIRDYQGAVAAEVTVTGDQKTAASKGFRLLAGYIFGSNTGQRKIAMTAPVAQQPTSEKIAMTAPVTQTPTNGAWVVRFTMPSSYTLDTLPRPNNSQVHLRQLPPARFVALRFSGLARPATVAERTAELMAFVQARHLKALGPASLAQYNPPWTPWFMRRNEVMVQIAG